MVSFLSRQALLCDDWGWHFAVADNLNSFTDVALDTWGLSCRPRTGSTAHRLQDLGLRDTFRERHPDTVAVLSWGAARLDQVWARSAPGAGLIVASAALIWQWSHRHDHDPPISDLLVEMPVVPAPLLPNPRPWRKAIAMMEDREWLNTARAQVATALAPAHTSFAEARVAFQRARGASGHSSPLSTLDAISTAADSIEGRILAAIPWPRSGPRRVAPSASRLWLRAARALRRLRTMRNVVDVVVLQLANDETLATQRLASDTLPVSVSPPPVLLVGSLVGFTVGLTSRIPVITQRIVGGRQRAIFLREHPVVARLPVVGGAGVEPR